ncbi:fasciclin-like arabinogalactan protein 14 [Selaginella moellendorffii]|nr:fasciclin-like arabinogalactan protein 14 [Selaginella moellendorffii]|eukprot:XP_002982557.2 fasciclin-like arabinogalactan protein 14 [Selaginella moellendorffii]
MSMVIANAATFLVLVLFSLRALTVLSINITQVLGLFPDYTNLNMLLLQTGVANEINQRSSLTILAAEDSVLDPILDQLAQSVTGQQIADILRYHVLLEYEGINDLRSLPNKSKLFTTLFQTTGRASNNAGFVNITDDPNGGVSVGWPSSSTVFSSEILGTVKELPFNVSVVDVSRVLVPYGLLPPSLMPLFLAPSPPPAESPSPSGGPPGPSSSPSPSSWISPSTSQQGGSPDNGNPGTSSAVAPSALWNVLLEVAFLLVLLIV